MGKWLSQFVTEHQGSLPDIPDTVDSVSGVSVPETQEATKTSPGAPPPVPPLPARCFVTWHDSNGKLCGGWDDRDTSIVKRCHGTGATSQVELSNGKTIPLRSVRAVGQLNAEGRLIAAWTVRAHGYEGEGPTR